MQKQKIIKLLLAIFPFLSLLTSATPVRAAFDWNAANSGLFFISMGNPAFAPFTLGFSLWNAITGIGAWIGGALAKSIASVLGLFSNILGDIAFKTFLTPFFKIIQSDPNILIHHSAAQAIWAASLTIANGLFLLALIIASVAIILRLNTGMYNLKKILSGFVIAVILSNLSFLIVKVLVELGDNLTTAVVSLYSTIDSRLTIDTVHNFIIALTDVRAPFFSKGAEAVPFIGTVLLAVTIMVIMIWILVKLAIVLLERIFWIFILAIFAPLIFAMSLLPTTQKVATDWWNRLIKWILVLPFVTAIISIAVYFLMLSVQIDKNTPINLVQFSESITDPTTFSLLMTTGSRGLLFIVGLVILYQAGRVPNILGVGSVAGGFVDTPKKLLGQGKVAYKAIADTATGRNLPGKVLQRARGLSGGILNKGGEFVANRLPKNKFAQKLRGLGTQLGGAPGVYGAWQDSIKKDKDRKRKIQTNRLAQLAAETSIGKMLDPDARQRLLNNRAPDIYGEIGKRTTTGFENDRNNIEQTKSVDEYIINMGIMSKAAYAVGLSDEERQQYASYMQTHQDYNKAAQTPKDKRTPEQNKLIDDYAFSDEYKAAKAVKNPTDKQKQLLKKASKLSDITQFEKERQASIYRMKGFDSPPPQSKDGKQDIKAVNYIDYMKSGQNIPEYKKALVRNFNKLSVDEFNVIKQITEGNLTPEIETEIRTKLENLGITDIEEQNNIIETASSQDTKEAITVSEATQGVKRDKSHNPKTTKALINRTINVLTHIQKSRKIINEMETSQSHIDTVQNARQIITNQVSNNTLNQPQVNEMHTNAKEVLTRITTKTRQTKDISNESTVRNLDLSGKDADIITKTRKVLNDSGLFVGRGVDTEEEINNSKLNTVLKHLSTIQDATEGTSGNSSTI